MSSGASPTGASVPNPTGQFVYVSNHPEQVPVSLALSLFARGNYLYSLSGENLVPFSMRGEAGEVADAAPLLILSNDVDHPSFESAEANTGPFHVNHWKTEDDLIHARRVKAIEEHDAEVKARTENDKEEKERKETLKANTFKGSSRYGRSKETLSSDGAPRGSKRRRGKKTRDWHVASQGPPSIGAVLAQAHIDSSRPISQQPHRQHQPFVDPHVPHVIAAQHQQPVFEQYSPTPTTFYTSYVPSQHFQSTYGPPGLVQQETLLPANQPQQYSPVVALGQNTSGDYSGAEAGGNSFSYQTQVIQPQSMQPQIIPAAPFVGSGFGYNFSHSFEQPPPQTSLPFQQSSQHPFGPLLQSANQHLPPALDSPSKSPPQGFGILMATPPAIEGGHQHRLNKSSHGAHQHRQESRQQRHLAASNQPFFSFPYGGQYGAIGQSPGRTLQGLSPEERALRTEKSMRTEEKKMLEKRLFKG
ncbi:hypothetical protein K490DRAFT_68141 [Saccharata proteae CBS 121410]|uniref:Uncharacterized protein n=1 Tax=Saccharata proteae CBS 121410 TaxID=1314787 RepID=A0A9P4HNH6_9PEZI|nr:hypothetical protein K490DRAFT_68141 [Saccharata proteae CBS 121410]